MNDSNKLVTGWALVGVQGASLVTLILLGGGDAWPTPGWHYDNYDDYRSQTPRFFPRLPH